MVVLSRIRKGRSAAESEPQELETAPVESIQVDIAPNDPLLPYLQTAGAPVELERLSLDSPAVAELREAGVELVVPLISQGELIGMLNLGRRLSDQPYSSDDRKLLEGLASQVAPAIRVAQLVRRQQAEAKERERIEHELRVASLIQQTLLPRQLPTLPGWEIEAYYRPAREVGGDFYDFIPLDGGRFGVVVGDVTDKGVPAALVMATCRSVLRANATSGATPGEILARANEILVADIPEGMFVTCLFAILDPLTGELDYANAGHVLPYVQSANGVIELRATGMPLGLMPGMTYEEKKAILESGDVMLLSSDGLTEAHSPDREMLGVSRVIDTIAAHPGGESLIGVVLSELDNWTGPDWEQEDDVTLVLVRRCSSAEQSARAFLDRGDWQQLGEFSLPSVAGNERVAMDRVAEWVSPLGMAPGRMERLKTAVAEATMNAIEHGNQNEPDKPVEIEVCANVGAVKVRIVDQGGGREVPDPETPDLEAKLEGSQTPRGWGLFLIRSMVDDMRVHTTDRHHTLEIEMSLEGESDAGERL
jgi:serine phosphatase RsbU (regulator of sigma subunit)/anti-sigma regulatory factor (Ser/Thr protein kinase)